MHEFMTASSGHFILYGFVFGLGIIALPKLQNYFLFFNSSEALFTASLRLNL